MNSRFPVSIEAALQQADVSWQHILRAALAAMSVADPKYLPELDQDHYLPTEGRLFAAFAQPLSRVRYILVGEGPYPRANSATGVCFMDGAVGSLWSEQTDGGLSKQVNRATSLRNLMKMLMRAAGQLMPDQLNPAGVAEIAKLARAPSSSMTQSLAQFQSNLHQHGFLLLNASLVFREHVLPKKEAKPWQVFLKHVLQGLLAECRTHGVPPPSLVLWGKIALDLQQLPVSREFPQIVAEHPYNLSFIENSTMHTLFAPMNLLQFPAQT